ncbi:MAG: toxin-antitoxin system protein [Deltaproteobacteria bacterium]|nr:toxin-antitoxin system protein [Deltaproteobacteria bacterium]
MPSSSSTIRISKESSNILREIATQEKKSLQTILDAAIEDYRRHRFLQEANKAYSVLKENPKTWEAELGERKRWDPTLSDGQRE